MISKITSQQFFPEKKISKLLSGSNEMVSKELGATKSELGGVKKELKTMQKTLNKTLEIITSLNADIQNLISNPPELEDDEEESEPELEPKPPQKKKRGRPRKN